MNPAPNQITECTVERQLCEWAAVYCTEENITKRADGIYLDVIGDDGYIRVIPYQPTSPTEKGKAQAWDLAVKYGLTVEFINGDYCAHHSEYYMGQSKGPIEHENPQIAVVKAALLCAIGD